MRVVLVDDHAVVRLAIRMILRAEGHDVVAECDNGADAVRIIVQEEPDIVVLDLDIPLLDGMAVIDRLRLLGNQAKIFIHTGLRSSAYTALCMRAGVFAYVSKMEDPQEIIVAMQAAINNKRYFPAETIISVRASDWEHDESRLLATLSRRELKVLHGLSVGLTNKLIAEDMLVSNKTVSTYKGRIMQKLGLSTLMDVIDFAKRNQVS